MTFKKGQTGNPKGRPQGAGEIAKLRESITEHVPEIITALISAAKSGDMQAARLLLERSLPAIKPTEHALKLALPDDSLTNQGRAVLAAMSKGEISTAQAAQLLSAIATLAKVSEIDELTERITKLEEINHVKKSA